MPCGPTRRGCGRRRSAPSGVRHNLVVPLGEQLVEAVAGEHVVELTVHAPFHDERCEALRRLIAALQPDHVTVLVQAGRTSVDPAALARVLDGSTGSSEVQLAAAPEFPDTSLHAKFVLVRTPARSITFTGSANLSLAALWRTDQRVGDRPAGNIELVNLSEGPPGRFDELLAGLDLVEPTEPIAQLDVRYLGDSEVSVDARLRLTRGTWADGTLTLVAAAELPAGKLTLIVAGTDTPADMTASGTTITGRARTGGGRRPRLTCGTRVAPHRRRRRRRRHDAGVPVPPGRAGDTARRSPRPRPASEGRQP